MVGRLKPLVNSSMLGQFLCIAFRDYRNEFVVENTIIVVLQLSFVLLLSLVCALDLREGEKVKVEDDVSGSLYAAGGAVSIDALVGGDLTAFGGSVSINKAVADSLVACGGDVSINSEIGGDVHACGGSVNINSVVDWNVDLQDIDKVLRIEAKETIKESEIINLIRTQGFYCETLND